MQVEIVEVTHSGLTPQQAIDLLHAVDQNGLCVTCRRRPAEGRGVNQCSACVDLDARAAKAVAQVPADLIGSPRMHAAQAVRRSYIEAGERLPVFASLVDAVDLAFEQAADAAYRAAKETL